MAELMHFQPGKTFYDAFQGARGNTLAKLAITGEGEQRKSALADLYGLDPEKAQAAQGQIKANDEQDYADMIDGAKVMYAFKDNPEMASQAYSRFKPRLEAKYGIKLPDTPDATVWNSVSQIVGAQQSALPSDVQSFEHFTQGMTPEEKDKARRIRLGLDQKVGAEGIKYLPNGGAAYEDPVSKKIFIINPGETTWREFSYPTAMGGTTQAPTNQAQDHNAIATNLQMILREAGFDEQAARDVADAYHSKKAGEPKGQYEDGVYPLTQPAPAASGAAQQQSGGAAWADTSKPKEQQAPPSGYRWKPDGTLEPIPGGAADPNNKDNAPKIAAVNSIRNDYQTEVKPYVDVMNAYEKMRYAAQDPSPAGDIALIYAYMKILDPTSVVREGEFATAQNAGSVPDSVRNTWNKLMNGERLAINRGDFLNQGAKLYVSSKEKYLGFKEKYKGIAQRNGINIDDVLVDGHTPISQKFPPKGQVYKPQTEADFAKIPKGSIYIDPDDGKQYRK